MEIAQPEPPAQPILDVNEQQLAPTPPAPIQQNLNFLHNEIPEDMLINDVELANQDMLEQQEENHIEPWKTTCGTYNNSRWASTIHSSQEF